MLGINFENGTILLNAQLQKDSTKGGSYYLSHALKNDKPRHITPATFVVEALRAYKVTHMKRQIKGWVCMG